MSGSSPRSAKEEILEVGPFLVGCLHLVLFSTFVCRLFLCDLNQTQTFLLYNSCLQVHSLIREARRSLSEMQGFVLSIDQTFDESSSFMRDRNSSHCDVFHSQQKNNVLYVTGKLSAEIQNIERYLKRLKHSNNEYFLQHNQRYIAALKNIKQQNTASLESRNSMSKLVAELQRNNLILQSKLGAQSKDRVYGSIASEKLQGKYDLLKTNFSNYKLNVMQEINGRDSRILQQNEIIRELNEKNELLQSQMTSNRTGSSIEAAKNDSERKNAALALISMDLDQEGFPHRAQMMQKSHMSGRLKTPSTSAAPTTQLKTKQAATPAAPEEAVTLESLQGKLDNLIDANHSVLRSFGEDNICVLPTKRRPRLPPPALTTTSCDDHHHSPPSSLDSSLSIQQQTSGRHHAASSSGNRGKEMEEHDENATYPSSSLCSPEAKNVLRSPVLTARSPNSLNIITSNQQQQVVTKSDSFIKKNSSRHHYSATPSKTPPPSSSSSVSSSSSIVHHSSKALPKNGIFVV
jgi:hypothetical protein